MAVFWTLCVAAIFLGMIKLALWWGHLRHLSRCDLVVLTHDSAHLIEGVIRTYQRLARLEGRDFRLYVIDGGSVDETLLIVDKFKQQGLQVEVIAHQELAESFTGAVDSLYGHLPEKAGGKRAEKDGGQRVREIRMVDMRRREA